MLDRTEPRAAPHNIEVEQALLGAMLVNNEAFFCVADFLEPKHFFEPLHQSVFDISGQLIRDGKVASPITIKTFLPADADLGGITVGQYLGHLAAEATSVVNAADYGQTIHDLATRRELIRLAEDMISVAYDAPANLPPAEQIRDAEERLFALSDQGRGAARAVKDIGDAVDDALARSQRIRNGEEKPFGVPFGLTFLDELTGGMQPGDLVILAGQTSMGKTAMAVNVAMAAAQAGYGVGYYSLEMTADPLARRLVASLACDDPLEGISHSRIKRGTCTDREYERLARAAAVARKLPIIIDESSGLTLQQIKARSKRLGPRLARKGAGLGLLVVDHLGLIRMSDRYKGNRAQEVGDLSAGLKELGKELGVPVLALSQLNRKAADGGLDGTRPQLHWLRDSGSLEQDADTVLFVFREAYALERKGEGATDEEKAKLTQVKNDLEVIIGKQRDGPITTVRCWCDLECNAVRDFSFGRGMI